MVVHLLACVLNDLEDTIFSFSAYDTFYERMLNTLVWRNKSLKLLKHILSILMFYNPGMTNACH